MMKNKGFSLVELLVVIAIMAVLAGVAVPVYSRYVQDAKKGRDNDYVAEIYRLACLEAAGEGLEVEEVVIALEDDTADPDINYAGELVIVKFKGGNEGRADAADRIIEAVWAQTNPYTFEHQPYYDWAAENAGVQGVFYNRTASGEYPYTIDLKQDLEPEETDEEDGGIKLPSIGF